MRPKVRPLLRHISSGGGPAERGFQFGRAYSGSISLTVALYERLFREILDARRPDVRRLGAEIANALARRAPAAAEEIAAIARGATLDEHLLFAVNGRSEILGASVPGECSVIGASPGLMADGRPLLVQNWDWHPDWADVCLMWTVHSPDGQWFTTFTEAGIIGKVGINSRGVACLLNRLGTPKDGGSDGLPIHVLLRLILETCDSLDEALDLVGSAELRSSACITLAGPRRDGGLAVTSVGSVEASPEGITPRWLQPGEWIAHTNHFVWSFPASGDVAPALWPDSYDRLRHLQHSLERCQHARTQCRSEDLLQLLASHAGPNPVCRHESGRSSWSDRTETLASIWLDPLTPGLWASVGPPCSNPYRYESAPLHAECSLAASDDRGLHAS